MDIYIQKDGQQAGPFGEAQIKAGISSGEFTVADLCWHDGLTEWKPLSEVIAFGSTSASNEESVPERERAIAYLVCISGPDMGKRAQLTEGTTLTLGRATDCNLLSDDPDVLDHHASIFFGRRQVTVTAMNGAQIFVDGLPLKSGVITGKQQFRAGRSFWQAKTPIDLKREAAAVFGKFADTISSVAGVEALEGLSGKEFFSSVLKKGSEEDIEELFITGTKRTTPALAEVDTSWPKPWAFFKAFIASVIVFAAFYYGLVRFYPNLKLLPGLVFVGSFGIPLSTLIFFVEMNVPRNVSLYQVFRLVIWGGVWAILSTLTVDSVLPHGNGWLEAIVAGIVEESAKVWTLTRLIKHRRFQWTLNGLLLGAAVGTGFGAFESAGYVFENLGEFGKGMMTMILRGFLAPMGHIVWTGLAGAALWKVKGRKPFQWEMLQDPRFLRVFVLVMAFHALWDAPIGIPFFGEWGSVAKCVLLGVVAWIIVLSYIQDGLKQIREAQKAEKGSVSPPPTPGISPATVEV